jgi:hypothetical protein
MKQLSFVWTFFIQTATKQLVYMPDYFEPLFFGNPDLHLFNRFIHKFYDFPTIQTHDMIMVFNSYFILEPGSSIAQVQPADEVIFYKDINGAVDGSTGYLDLALPQ